MDFINNNFEDIKKTKNPELINDFLIKLSKNPSKDHLDYLKYFIENLETQIFEEIILNLVFTLGEIGSLTTIGDFFINFLYETYFQTDRWIRNEIIQAINKISKKLKLNEIMIRLIGSALYDDYQPIKINALKVIQGFETLPAYLYTNLFRVLNLKDPKVLVGCNRVLEKFHLNSHRLFNLLTQCENYKILKPRAIRSLLLIYFKSLIKLESLRTFIMSSDWDESFKMKYLKEIDTFQRIMVKNT